MGGNIAWTLRLSDGTEHRMDRWTNPLPDVLVDPAFLAEEPEAIARALKSWLEMGDDWRRNGPDGPFEHNMTEVYAPYPYGLKPSEYGFVVTDFPSRTVIACNHYFTLGRACIDEEMPLVEQARADVALDPVSTREFEALDLVRDYEALRRQFDEGSIVAYDVVDEECFKRRVDVTTETFAEVVDLATRSAGWDRWKDDPRRAGLRRQEGRVFVRPKGWTFLNLPKRSEADRRAAYEAVKALGFALTPDEEAGWASWIKGDEDDE